MKILPVCFCFIIGKAIKLFQAPFNDVIISYLILYNEEVRIVKPRDFLISPSNAQYRIVNSLVVEPIEGDPENLENATLYQDEYKFGGDIKKTYALTGVNVKTSECFFQILWPSHKLPTMQ